MKRAGLGCLGISAALVLSAAPVRAEENTLHGAGVIGGALVLGEAVVIGEALASVEPGWAYVAGASAGAAAGGYVGWRMERDAQPRASEVMLGVGLGLLVPTLVWVGNLRAERAAPQARQAQRALALWATPPARAGSAPADGVQKALDLRTGFGVRFSGTF